ncbi:MAG: translation initiation factor [Bacteroidia bacterium]
MKPSKARLVWSSDRRSWVLKVIVRRLGGGKERTEITGFLGDSKELEALAKALRQHCATGGSVSEGTILLQGNCAEKAANFLASQGYNVRRS